jgi:hypothetical protein
MGKFGLTSCLPCLLNGLSTIPTEPLLWNMAVWLSVQRSQP